jgi:hypothetical protein
MRLSYLSLIPFALIGCAGDAPPNVGGGPDAPGADAPPVDVGLKVTGKAMDYFTAATPMADATITTEGINPPAMATSATGGLYELDAVPQGSKIYATVAHTLYRPTRNAVIAVDAMPVMTDLYMLTIADVNRQYATAGVPVGPGKAFFAADLVRNNGTPLEGIPLTAITLVDTAGTPVPGTIGPYFFGAAGDIDLALTTATAYNGKSRVAFLDVPPGAYTLSVTYLNAMGTSMTVTVPASFLADGATLATTGGMGGGGGGGGALNPTFTTDIYPRLQKAATGGLGCANCHTAGGLAGNVLKYDDPADITLANIKAANVLDLVTPANSLFLTKPLYEPPPYNHPNATFVDVNDPDYKLFLRWIQQGAL